MPSRFFLLKACVLASLSLVSIPTAGGAEEPFVSADAFPVSFDSEWVRLSIVGDSLEIRGTYFLRCRERDGARVSLFYPFPQDSLLGGARMVSLHAGVAGTRLGALRWQASDEAPGVRWDTPPCTGDTIAVEAVYRQKLTASYARYIVTTTRVWRRPLRHARFDIRLPAGAVPTEFSFPFAAREDTSGSYYTFETNGFFPDRDIVVRWRVGESE
jgi:hypothetical protein